VNKNKIIEKINQLALDQFGITQIRISVGTGVKVVSDHYVGCMSCISHAGTGVKVVSDHYVGCMSCISHAGTGVKVVSEHYVGYMSCTLSA
jgi:hypothetical protein